MPMTTLVKAADITSGMTNMGTLDTTTIIDGGRQLGVRYSQDCSFASLKKYLSWLKILKIRLL
jgi:hypothetical protein